MGDISEMRGLIVLFTVVSLTVALIMLMPSDYFTAGTTMPNTYNNTVLGIIAWNSSYTQNKTHNAIDYFTLNGYTWYFEDALLTEHLTLGTYSTWWIFNYDFDFVRWINTTGYDLSQPQELNGIPELRLETFTGSSPYEFEAKNGRTSLKITFSYNTTAYASWTEALAASELYAIFNADWTDRNTSMNALGVVGLVLTASLPNIDPVVNGVFALIAWGFIAVSIYLVFIFVLRIVGAVFGGGGA